MASPNSKTKYTTTAIKDDVVLSGTGSEYYGASSIKDFLRDNEETQILSPNSTATIKHFNKDEIFTKVLDIKEQKQATSYSLITEEWEGCITEIMTDSFRACLYSHDEGKEEVIEGEFNIRDIPEDERHLIKEGMVFYWMIGKEVKKSKQIINGDFVIFRRMPSWKKFDINADSKKTEDFFAFLSGPDKHTS